MKTICGIILAAAVAFAAFGDSLGNIGDVRLKGRLGERLDAMIARHVADRDVDYITAPFMEKTETKGWWQTEFWGKWMHAAVPPWSSVNTVRQRRKRLSSNAFAIQTDRSAKALWSLSRRSVFSLQRRVWTFSVCFLIQTSISAASPPP